MNKPRILVVEDEAIVAMDIRRRLSLLGYEVAGSVAQGEAAIHLARTQRPDLVLMDIRLQGPVDGVTAAIQIRQDCHLPVVFLTAYAEEATIEQAKLAEPFGYILKPFEDRELKTIIEMALYKHRADEEIRHLNRLYAFLSQASQTIARVTSREELFPAICRIAVEHGAFKAAWIGAWDPTGRMLQPAAQWGDPSGCLSQPLSYVDSKTDCQDPAATAIYLCRPGIINDLLDERCQGRWRSVVDAVGVRSAAVVPIRMRNEVCGTLSVYAVEPGFFGEREIRLLEEVVLDISRALDNMEQERRRRMAEDAALAAERQWRTTFDAIGDAVCLIDLNGRIQRANRAMATLTNLDHNELVGCTCFEVVHPEACPASNCPLARMRQSHHRESMVLQRGNRWCEVVVDPLFDESGQLVGAVHIVTDISERMNVEQERQHLQTQLIQAQKMEAVGQLAGGVAHDFNNILTAVMMHLNLLQDDSHLSAETRAGLAELVVETKRAANLTRQLLMFSRRQVLKPQPLDLNSLLGNFLKMLRRLIGEQITLEFNGAPGDLWIEADPGMLEQVVMNLLVNARDAMPKGGRVTLKTRQVELDEGACQSNPEARAGAFVCLSVSDTGCGMDEAVAKRIFEPFFTTKEVGKGTGLGLATVYGIVKQHLGWIEVDTAPGRGSTFTAFLPAKPHLAPRLHSPELAAAVPGGREHLLLVEDEDSVRRSTGAVLRQLGYLVQDASNGPEALRVWEQARGSFDLVISDIVMPGGTSGLELTEQLVRNKPGLQVILISGYSTTLVDQGMPDRSGFHFLQKPYESANLARMVRQCLDERPLSSSAPQ
jgi:two-component system, cell cycle sensor histidine kinase and response regulator CckA